MDNLITGLISIVLLFLFLGFYAYKVISVPLWIIIAGVLVMVVYDFYESVTKGEGQNGE